ncbi:DedA family protein [Isoptericola sp. b441]|uniref:DedA family protein n=1 Tax=Actinotalea lenta TaxID=3064654 RepID=A0ABT9DBN9_9CELL|nr:DedA family protein [Isoptericola sp. b441]MDO8107946.1 DedA family protein [Isoptericola sp. b441]
MTGLIDQLLNAPGWLVLVVTGLAVFAEDALFVGFVVPGETVAVLAGVAAERGQTSLAAAMAVVVAAAVAGDSVGYEVGKHLGQRLMRIRPLVHRQRRIRQAQDYLARRGAPAVFLGRWTAFFRAVMPALAGTARMPYGRFLAFNALGGLTWGVAVVTVGYLAGASYARVEHTFGRYAALAVAGIVLVAVAVIAIRRHRSDTRDPADHGCAEPPSA